MVRRVGALHPHHHGGRGRADRSAQPRRGAQRLRVRARPLRLPPRRAALLRRRLVCARAAAAARRRRRGERAPRHAAAPRGAKARRGRQGRARPTLLAEDDVAYADAQAKERAETVATLDRLAAENFQLREVLAGVRTKIRWAAGSPTCRRRRGARSLPSTSARTRSPRMRCTAAAPSSGATAPSARAVRQPGQRQRDGAARVQGHRLAAPEGRLRPRRPQRRRVLAAQERGELRAHRLGGAGVGAPRHTPVRPADRVPESALPLARARPRRPARLRLWDGDGGVRNGRGAPKPSPPRPRSSLEAMSMIAYAKQQGITAFFAWTPRKAAAPVRTHWSGLDGQRFTVPAGDAAAFSWAPRARTPSSPRPFSRASCRAPSRSATASCARAAMAAPPPPPGSAAGARRRRRRRRRRRSWCRRRCASLWVTRWRRTRGALPRGASSTATASPSAASLRRRWRRRARWGCCRA